MVRITEELVRKRAEHNEREICSLEELSLHQENIEKIEHLQNWCKNLQILLLQGNIISRIENLHKLKHLQYLNLAINNIEMIENLERCESLEKLDLTLNFIGNIESVCSLRNNINLKDLYLTGNPCVDFKGYRNYVVAKLPYLQNLDNEEITRSERIKALQIIESVEKQVLIDQEKYLSSRNEQKDRLSKINNDEIPDELFWKQETENCPEVRVEMAKRQRRARANEDEENKEIVKQVTLFTKDGRPLNINQPKVKFNLSYDDSNEIVLDIAIYKYLDTTHLEVDLQPTYVTVRIKGKVFQLVLPEEIATSKSVAQRSQTTGHLVIRMPKLNIKPDYENKVKNELLVHKEVSEFERKQRREFLEIGPDRLTEICNIAKTSEKQCYVDDADVPPLE